MIEKFVLLQEAQYKQRQEREKIAIAATTAAAAAAAAASSAYVINGTNSQKDEAMPDAEKLRMTRLKVFGGTLPAFTPTLSLAAQPAGQNDEMVIDPRP